MSKGNCCGICVKQAGLYLAIILGMLLGGLLIRRMLNTVHNPEISQDRIAERQKNLKEHRQGVSAAVMGYGVVNEGEGIYRIPIERALELSAQEWQNPGAARALLTNRVVRSLGPLPPAGEAAK